MCPVYTDKRSGRLFVQFDYKRQTFKQYLPEGSTRTQANKLEVKMRSDAFFQANGMAPRNEVLFDDAVQEYLEHIHGQSKYYRAELVLIAAKPFLKNKLLRSIKPVDIERFMFDRMKRPTMHGTERKPATVWREIASLSALFTYCVKSEYLDANPCARVEKPAFDNVQDRVLSREDEVAFLAAFDPQYGQPARDICILVLNTGLRQNDILNLNTFQIRDEWIRLIQGKTKRTVEIPLNAVARAIVERYSRKDYLFGRMKSIRTAIRGACKRVNKARKERCRPEMPTLTIRDLRRTFATRLAEDGVDALTIAMLLGHRDLRMVHRYARSIETMQKAVENLAVSTPALPERIAKNA